jgi:hypothetical protein
MYHHHHMALHPNSGPGLTSWGFVTITFCGAGLLVQRPTPNLEDQASVFMTPGNRMAQLYPQALGTHFCRLLRNAWVTVRLLFNPGHHMGPLRVCITTGKIRVISGGRGGYEFSAPCPVYLPGQVAFNQCQTSSPSALELRRAETTTCASQLEAQLQPGPVEQFQESHVVVEQSDCQVAVRGPRQCHRKYQLKR